MRASPSGALLPRLVATIDIGVAGLGVDTAHISFPGVKVGDSVVVNPNDTDTYSPLVATAFVSSAVADRVDVRFNNPTNNPVSLTGIKILIQVLPKE